MDDEILDDGVGFAFEGVEVDRSSGPLDEPRHPPRLAHHFHIADEARQCEFWRLKLGNWIFLEDGVGGNAELGLHRRFVLRGRQARREASIRVDPAFVPRCADDDGDAIERSSLVERARLIGNIETVDHRAPGDPWCLGELLLTIGKRQEHLRHRLRTHTREHLRRVRAADGCGEIIAKRFGVGERRPPARRIPAVHDRSSE